MIERLSQGNLDMYVELQVENKRSNVRRLVIRTQATVGRQASCDIRVVSDEISREHCQICVHPQGAVLIDLGSTNGTFLNKKQIKAHSEVALKDNDIIHAGPAAFVVHLVEVELADETYIADDETLTAADSKAEPRVSFAGMATEEDFDEPMEETLPSGSQDLSDSSEIELELEEDELLEAIEVEEELVEKTEVEEDASRLAGVTSDSDMSTMTEDEAFDRFLKNL